MPTAVASRYARALGDILTGPNAGVSADDAVSQLRQFAAMQDGSVELQNVMASPAVTPGRKKAVAAKLGEMLGFGKILRNFLFVLIDHRRMGILGEILDALEALLDERRGIVRATVTSARGLDDGQRQAVEVALGRLTGKQVFGKYEVDGALIGGLVARVGSRVYDGSVRGQLQAMRGRLVRS
jgi:F-type H+-transporting ATPase subunit delta